MSDHLNVKNRLNSNSALMTMLLQTTSFDQVDAFFDVTRSQEGALINVADAKQGVCFEWAKIIAIPEGKKASFTKERTANL